MLYVLDKAGRWPTEHVHKHPFGIRIEAIRFGRSSSFWSGILNPWKYVVTLDHTFQNTSTRSTAQTKMHLYSIESTISNTRRRCPCSELLLLLPIPETLSSRTEAEPKPEGQRSSSHRSPDCL